MTLDTFFTLLAQYRTSFQWYFNGSAIRGWPVAIRDCDHCPLTAVVAREHGIDIPAEAYHEAGQRLGLTLDDTTCIAEAADEWWNHWTPQSQHLADIRIRLLATLTLEAPDDLSTPSDDEGD